MSKYQYHRWHWTFEQHTVADELLTHLNLQQKIHCPRNHKVHPKLKHMNNYVNGFKNASIVCAINYLYIFVNQFSGLKYRQTKMKGN